MSQITMHQMDANQFVETAEPSAQRITHDFELLMHLFPNEHPSGIHGVLCITNNDVVQAIDILLYLQRHRDVYKQHVIRPAVTTADFSSMTSLNAPQPSTSACTPRLFTSTIETPVPWRKIKQEFCETTSLCGPSTSAELTVMNNSSLAMDLSNTAEKVQNTDEDIIICDSDEDEKDYVVLQPMIDQELEFTLQGLVPPVFRVASLYR